MALPLRAAILSGTRRTLNANSTTTTLGLVPPNLRPIFCGQNGQQMEVASMTSVQRCRLKLQAEYLQASALFLFPFISPFLFPMGDAWRTSIRPIFCGQTVFVQRCRFKLQAEYLQASALFLFPFICLFLFPMGVAWKTSIRPILCGPTVFDQR